MLSINFDLIIRCSSLILLPISLTLLLSASKYYPEYSIKTHWISNLDKTDKASRTRFCSGLVMLLLCGPSLLSIGSTVLSGNGLFQILFLCILFLMFLSIVGVLASPTNVKIIWHLRWAFVLLTSIFIFHVLYLVLVINLIAVSYFLTVLSTSSLVLCILFSLSTVKFTKKFKLSLDDLKSIRAAEKSWLIRNTTLLEWSILVINYLWIFYLTLSQFI
jgi:hypothetical protein